MRKIIVSVLISLVASNGFAQTQFTGWLASFNTFKIGKKTSIHFDAQVRSADELEHVQTVLVRTGLNFHVTRQLTLTAGYAFVDNRRTIGSVTGFVVEHRAWEQLLFNHKVSGVAVGHRLRLEQRFLPLVVVRDNKLHTDDHTMAMRLRYWLRNVIPFKKTAEFQRGFFGWSLQQNINQINVGACSKQNLRQAFSNLA